MPPIEKSDVGGARRVRPPAGISRTKDIFARECRLSRDVKERFQRFFIVVSITKKIDICLTANHTVQNPVILHRSRIAVVNDKPPVSGEKSVVCFAIAIHTVKCYERTAFCPK